MRTMTLNELTDQAQAMVHLLENEQDKATAIGNRRRVSRLEMVWLKANRRFWRRYNRQMARQSELFADLADAYTDLQHASTNAWRQASRRSIELIEAELATLVATEE